MDTDTLGLTSRPRPPSCTLIECYARLIGKNNMENAICDVWLRSSLTIAPSYSTAVHNRQLNGASTSRISGQGSMATKTWSKQHGTRSRTDADPFRHLMRRLQATARCLTS
jgi:hypothetical protein